MGQFNIMLKINLFYGYCQGVIASFVTLATLLMDNILFIYFISYDKDKNIYIQLCIIYMRL